MKFSVTEIDTARQPKGISRQATETENILIIYFCHLNYTNRIYITGSPRKAPDRFVEYLLIFKKISSKEPDELNAPETDDTFFPVIFPNPQIFFLIMTKLGLTTSGT